MALFFYRPWAGDAISEDVTPAEPFYYTRWGYAALLGITLFVGLVLNSVYLLGYLVCPGAMLQVPHVAIVGLAIRDLIVCLIVIPAAIDWFIVGLSTWSGGDAWCATAIFFDFYLNALYPLLLITLCVILYTRKVPPVLPPSREPSLRVSSRMSNRSGYTHRTHNSQQQRSQSYSGQQQQQFNSNRLSVPNQRMQGHSPAGSQQGMDPAGFRKGFSKSSRENSIAGSERGYDMGVRNGSIASREHRAGSVAGSRGDRAGSVDRSRGDRSSSVPGNRGSGNGYLAPPQRQMRSGSSPLKMVEEEYAPSLIGSDLWDAASLGYPGLDEFEMDHEDDEPRLREWLQWFIPVICLLSLGFGIPAAASMETVNSPGCYVHVNPFENPNSYIINDPGFNLMICSVVFTYIAPGLLMIFFSLLLCTTRWTKDGKLNRFYKMCIALCAFFIAVKSPVDIIQFKDLVYSAYGSKQVNRLPNTLEHDVLIFWAAILPVVGNPIIYLTCVSDYRVNIAQAWKLITGKQDKEALYIDEYKDNKLTEESDVL
ncbi:uncharacterized protein LOC111698230 [Eurytemora carolleeae]|uniref:uncharacterized protein LOC111698230 n=1 Tax=Eurytemora carolleeae TaxID=1294199 RepID=UPI000C788BF6|nr:uncharacterized protein LOC111698230 [Eurytemora carolleeae]|eukprot:XP_023324282.1 uncharacterized protein LOC111698230 [Eurytemora affinis]